MSEEEEKIRKIAEMRELLEEKAKSLEAELEGLRILLDFINNLLLEKSFKRVDEIVKPVSKTPEVQPWPPIAEERGKAIPLKTGTGELLANLFIEDGFMKVIPDADKRFNVSIPPFTAFLVERILMKMQESDQDAIKRGELQVNQVLAFNITKDGETIREITVKNISPPRERELRSAIRWTFEKMYEKMKGPS